jgi:pyridoxine 4-dehydrogenase
MKMEAYGFKKYSFISILLFTITMTQATTTATTTNAGSTFYSPSLTTLWKNNQRNDDGTQEKIELQVPLAIGTLQWGTTWIDDKFVNGKGGALADEAVSEILQICGSARVTLYDTAEGYGGGTSERRLGRLLVSKSPNDNDKKSDPNILIMTKFLPAPWRCFQRDLVAAARASCQRLNGHVIDVYLLHSPMHWLRPIEYWIEACAQAKREGWIRTMGLSNCNSDQVERAVQAGQKYGIDVVCNQVHYSLLDYNSPSLQQMQETCKKFNVKIIGFTPLGQGLLTDGLTTEKWQSIKPVKMLRLVWDDVQPVRNVLHELAQKYQKTMAQIALNWCICHDVIPLVGCRSPSQARDSVGCLHWKLSEDDVQALDKVALAKSTLDSPPWRRMLFVGLFGIVMVTCRTLDTISRIFQRG